MLQGRWSWNVLLMKKRSGSSAAGAGRGSLRRVWYFVQIKEPYSTLRLL